MARIIITLTDSNQTFAYDLEVPTDLEYEALLDDIVQTIISYNPDLTYQPTRCRLHIPKLGRMMQNGETPESVGLWNGDYLSIVEERPNYV